MGKEWAGIFLLSLLVIYSFYLLGYDHIIYSAPTSTLLKKEATIDYEQNRRELANSVSPIYKRFESTVKSCLGSHCMNELFTNDIGEKITRIGILLPHTKDWTGLLYCISKVESKLRKDHTITISTHVPPYGYGRNHGWTKIIRIIDNVLDDSYRLLLPFNNSEIFEQLYEIQARMQSVVLI